jgi:hypothetical protein
MMFSAITVPDVLGQNCRMMVAITANIYYALNAKPLVLGTHLLLLAKPMLYNFICYTRQAAYTTRTITVPASSTAVVSNVVLISHTLLFLRFAKWK